MSCDLAQKENSGKDFSDCNFAGKDLSGYNFHGCSLLGTDFSQCTFDASTDFTDAIFGVSSTHKSTSFSGCDLSAAKFTSPLGFRGNNSATGRLDLTHATVPWELLGKNLQFMDLSHAALPNMPTDLSQAMFNRITWRGFDFRGKNLRNAHFMNCDLTDCVMSGINLNYASFVQICDLTRVKMDRCSLYHTVFDGSTMTCTDLSFATKIGGCTFLNALLKGTVFDGNDLTTCTFSIPAALSMDPDYITSFNFASITTDFLVTNLALNWQCTDLRNVQVAGFDAITGKLHNLIANHALFNNTLSFKNAKLNGADFTGASFNGVDFSGALINNARLVDIKTLAGNEMGPSGAIFSLAQNDPSNQSPYDYGSFLKDLTGVDDSSIIDLFAHFGYTVGDLTITTTEDPLSGYPAWSIQDGQATPRKSYLVVKAPQQNSANFTLFAYDNSKCIFSNAQMVSSYLEGAQLNNSLMDQTQLYGATLTYSNLSNVNMTGAQLGKNAAVFTVSQTNSALKPPYDYASFLKDLQTPVLVDLIGVFSHLGYIISNISCAATTPPPGAAAAWLIKDNSTNPMRTFTAAQLVIQQSPKAYELAVYYNDALPALLDFSYMPGIVLSQANLSGCSIQNCHLYNDQETDSVAMLNHTILLEARFDYSNLYKSDFSDAILSGASFTGANLMGAVFKGVTLGPSESGHNVSFESTNLQGTDFLSASIQGGNFLNAAMCVPVSASDANATNGVWLYEVTAGDAQLADYIQELESGSTTYSITTPPPSFLVPGPISADLVGVLSGHGISVSASAMVSVSFTEQTWKIADGTDYLLIPGFDSSFTVAYNVYLEGTTSALCDLDYATALQAGTVTANLIQTLKTNSANRINLSPNAVLSTYPRPVVWNIVDATAVKSYTLWWGVQPSGTSLANVTYVRSAVPILIGLFQKFLIGLRQQTFIAKSVNAADDTTTWTVDMGTDDPYYLQTGYIRFNIVGNSATQVTALDVYGYTMRMSGKGNQGTEVIQDFDCEITIISPETMDEQTLLPNNRTKAQNVQSRAPFDKWVQYYKLYPNPPICVPTPISYCPSTNSPAKSEEA